ncbi:hypothetical protein [Kordiimonas marina]|uniref:hypothetical protein n=1 Tax=Kordiimonas marina TaxID=2872312 RepID=UPI001FF3642F|nr:hypothetical protein [Kordiimonas marina]MCJ9428427.1 hypothetical protein [Kordiimonas marina]
MTTISGVQGGGHFGPPPGKALTDDQKKQISDILSNYDPSKLTKDDAKAIVSQLQDAGIQPGKGFAEAFKAAGFDAKAVGEKAGLKPPKGGPGGPGGPGGLGGAGQGGGLNAKGLQTLKDVLSNYDLSNLSADDEKSIVEALKGAGLLGEQGESENGGLVSVKA